MLHILALLLLLMNGLMSGQTSKVTGHVTVSGQTNVRGYPICPNAPTGAGGLNLYSNLTCVQTGSGGTVLYIFPDISTMYVSTGTVIVPANHMRVILDPNGPYTLLIGSDDWNLTAGQTTHMVINFKARGPNVPGGVNPWAHHCDTVGTGIVTTHQIILSPFVDAISSCTNGSFNEPQNPTADAGGLLDMQVVVDIQGNTGTASLQSLGTHIQ